MIKIIRINFHSVVDVITNSSTTVYVGCSENTIKYAKDLINTLLKAAKSEKTADDVFKFIIKVDEETEKERLSEEFENFRDDILKIGFSKEDIANDDKQEEIVNKLYDNILSGKINEPDDWGKNYSRDFDTRSLILVAKEDDAISINLADELSSIFSLKGSYDG